MTQTTGRVLIVEDNPTTARTLTVFLEAEGLDVAWSANGRDAIARSGAAPFDLVVLDLMLPDLDGLSVCRAIRASSMVPIVMLTARTSDADVVEGLEAGADDYVCKPFASKVLLARVRRCLERARHARRTDGLLSHKGIVVTPQTREVTVEGQAVRLTRTEFELLVRFMRSPGRVFTRSQLLEETRGDATDAFDRVVDTHIWSLRRKLGEPRGRPTRILSEPGVGYRLSDDDAN